MDVQITSYLIILSILTACAPVQPMPSNIDSADLPPTPEIVASTTTPAVPAEIVEAKGVTMRLVPAGEFTMGSDLNPVEKPVHTLYLDACYIDKYEVTNQAYQKCVDAGVCKSQIVPSSASRKDYYDNPEFSNYPLIHVTWVMADTFCQWRDARLPTEAEWEKAARGTDARIYPWGNEFSCSFANLVIPGKPCMGDTTAVGSYETGVSPYGLDDMAGNVAEWPSSVMKPYPYDKNDGREDPSASQHIVRGGTWYYTDETFSRATEGDGLNSLTYDKDIGFRCVREVEVTQ